jgi:phage-related baseplate assembly protein
MSTASDSFTGVDLSRLPAPGIVETLSFEAIYAEWLSGFQAVFPEFDATVESDPVVKMLQFGAFRELIWRQRVNDAARAVMPAFALGADLDNLAATFGIERFILTPADPDNGVAEVLESDDAFRRRMVLAPEGYSVAGPEGAYIFHALSADGDVLDASAISPEPGEVLVTVLSRSGDGTPDGDVLAAVETRLNLTDVRPLTDLVTVQAAEVIDFVVTATIKFLSGPDRSVVLAAAQERLTLHLERSRRLGRDITRAGIIGSLFVEGIQNVVLAEPAADVVLTRLQAQNCTAVNLTDGGVAE